MISSAHTAACSGCNIHSFVPLELRYVGAGLICPNCYTEQNIIDILVPIQNLIPAAEKTIAITPPPANSVPPLPTVEEDPWWLTGLKFIGLAAGAVVSAAVVYRGLRAVMDHDFGGRAYPESYRRKLIQEHLDQYGARCNSCGKRVPISSLTVDHQFPHARGGATSTWNSDVLCQPCNSRKGTHTNLLIDLFLS